MTKADPGRPHPLPRRRLPARRGAVRRPHPGRPRARRLRARRARRRGRHLELRRARSTTSCSTRCPRLRAVGNEGVGFDTIDVAALERRGIALCIPRGQNADAVADHALGLLLAVRHNVVAGDRFIREGQWGAPRAARSRPAATSPARRSASIGLGNIGRAVARRAEAFGMRVVGWNRTPRPESGIEQVALDDLLAQSDHVTLHCALADDTRGLIGERELGPAAADGGPDQHRARRDRRHRGADRRARRATGCGAPASTCSRRSPRSTRGCSSTRAWSSRRTSPTTSPSVYGALTEAVVAGLERVFAAGAERDRSRYAGARWPSSSTRRRRSPSGRR